MTTRLITGGARSGKFRHAEGLLADTAAVTYVATSQGLPDDAEWAARVAAHRVRRPSSWRTIETLDVAGVLNEPGPPVLVDCLTVWLSRVMDESGCWPDVPGEGWAKPDVAADPDSVDDPAQVLATRVNSLVDAVGRTTREVVLVTNEVGQGLVPTTAGGRLFRDEMGVLNLEVAAVCDEVWLIVAGLPLRLGA
ncbi:MAG: bifunctional adenosylcobinamide kinase/adenosylcobinamide-phosphate guanylyltransferase [Propionibacteriaceae bacterium]